MCHSRWNPPKCLMGANVCLLIAPATYQHSPRHVGKFPVIGLRTVLSALCLAIKYTHLLVSKELPGLPAVSPSPQPLLPGLTPCLVNLI